MIELHSNITLEMKRWSMGSITGNSLLGWTAVHNDHLKLGMAVEAVLGLPRQHHIDINFRGRSVGENSGLFFMKFK